MFTRAKARSLQDITFTRVENPLPGLKSGAGTDQAMACYKNGSSFSLLPIYGA
jgi:hypothetical protein